jgi:DNA-directed RNA polymerase specialized sigma24 family protein
MRHPEFREIIDLTVLRGMTVAQAASMIGISTSAAAMRRQRAFKYLRSLYENLGSR